MMISLVFLQFSSVLFARNKEVAAMFYVERLAMNIENLKHHKVVKKPSQMRGKHGTKEEKAHT